MANPLSTIDTIIQTGLADYAPLAALVSANDMQFFDRVVDAREMEEAADLSRRIWVYPTKSRVDFEWSSGSAWFARHYGIGFGSGNMRLSLLRELEWSIICACRLMYERLVPNGAASIADPTPLLLESIFVTDSDPEREPIADPQEWTDVCDVIVNCTCARSAIVS